MRIAVITDSTAFLSEEAKQNKDLFVLPIPVIMEGNVYKEGIDIIADGYYEKLKSSKEFPTTSQPPLGEFIELYKNLVEKGYDGAISIFLSSGISGTVKTAESVIQEFSDFKLAIIDSKITSSPMGSLVDSALVMIDEGKEFSEIVDVLNALTSNVGAFIIVEDLNNLVRGGRLTNGAAILGGLLKIKPILRFDDVGKIVLFEKIRSSKKAFQRLDSLIEEMYKKEGNAFSYFIIHANNKEKADEQKNILEEICPGIKLKIHHFGPVIGTHLGEKAIGFGWAKKYK